MVVANSNKSLLEDVGRALKRSHSHIYMSLPQGSPTGGLGTRTASDQWNLMFYRREVVRRLLAELPFRHQEKIDKAKIGLDVLNGCKWEDARTRIENLWKDIENDIAESAMQARTELDGKTKKKDGHTRAGSRYSPNTSRPT